MKKDASVTFYELMDVDFTGIEIDTPTWIYRNFDIEEGETFANQRYDMSIEDAMALLFIFEKWAGRFERHEKDI